METLNINNTEKVQNLDEIFYIKFSKIFKKKIDKILFIIPPDASKETFNLDLVLAKRYPAFPPYGAGLLVRNLKDKFKDNINCNILDLNFELLKSAHEKGREFNYDIWKEHVENNIKTDIYELDNEDRIEEIAGMISGKEITDSALKQAEELLK